MKKLSYLNKANVFFRDGNYKEAIELYKKVDSPPLVNNGFISFNICFAEKKWTQERNSKKTKNNYSSPVDNSSIDAFNFSHDSYLNYLSSIGDLYKTNNKIKLPKVSVIMTCFNAEETIQESIESLLNQNYPNIEVIVCDDYSCDNSWNILCEMKRRCGGLRVIRNNENYGTYLSKNRALEKSTGEIILFQDSDDISHPGRVMAQVLPLLKNESIVATRTKYLRYNDVNRKIIRVGGLDSKFGLITLAVRRKVFNAIGYFDAVRRAGDDEWVQRLLFAFGKGSMENVDVTLYLARLRENSLVTDMIKFDSSNQHVEQTSSFARRVYVDMFKSRFSSYDRRQYYRESFPPFPLHSNMNYPDTIHALDVIGSPVIVCLCSIPSREASLLKTIRSLQHQVDKIYLYLDKYKGIPKELSSNKKIIISCSENFNIDFRDNGKFLFFNKLKEEYSDFFYFTCDDDIEYPHDYVHSMIRNLKYYDYSAVVGVHGVVIEESPSAYFKRRYTYNFEANSLSENRIVNNLGTGTIAFHSSIFPSIDPVKWSCGGMVDIHFSIECLKKSIPMVCVSRHAGWLQTFVEAKDTPTLFNEFNEKESLIVKKLKKHEPWGMKAIVNTISSFDGELNNKLLKGVPVFAELISISSSFQRYR